MADHMAFLEESVLFKILNSFFSYLGRSFNESIFYLFFKETFRYSLKAIDVTAYFFRPLVVWFQNGVVYKILSFKLDEWR